LPIYAQEILRVGPRGYGLLSSSLEIGAIATSVVLMTRPPVRRTGRTLLAAVGVYGAATIVFGASRWFPLSVAAYMLVGAADQVSVVMRSTTIQLATPDELRGRVSAMNLLFIGASNQLGAAESGFVAALTSAPFAVVSGGVACLVVLAMVAATNPALRAYRIARADARRGAPDPPLSARCSASWAAPAPRRLSRAPRRWRRSRGGRARPARSPPAPCTRAPPCRRRGGARAAPGAPRARRRAPPRPPRLRWRTPGRGRTRRATGSRRAIPTARAPGVRRAIPRDDPRPCSPALPVPDRNA